MSSEDDSSNKRRRVIPAHRDIRLSSPMLFEGSLRLRLPSPPLLHSITLLSIPSAIVVVVVVDLRETARRFPSLGPCRRCVAAHWLR